MATELSLAEIKTFYVKGRGVTEESIADTPYKELYLGMTEAERQVARFTPLQNQQFIAGGVHAVTKGINARTFLIKFMRDIVHNPMDRLQILEAGIAELESREAREHSNG